MVIQLYMKMNVGIIHGWRWLGQRGKRIGLQETFAAIVSAEDAVHGKPHPEVFLKAAERLQLAPEHCVVFEDAYVGIEAGHAAGMRVVAVTTTHSMEELKAADIVVRRLDELAVEQLASVS